VPATVNVNGRVYDQEHAVISVFDHGFLYGEGVYETLRTFDGRPFLFDRHMQRLRNSAGMLMLPVPVSDEEMAARCRATMNAAGLGERMERMEREGFSRAPEANEAYLRILLTRGVGELSYDPAGCPEPSIVIIVKPQIDPPASAYAQGMKLSIVNIVRNHPGTVNPLIKSNNLLNNALAMQEAARRGADEGVMRNFRGELAECTTSNLFIVKAGAALTPPLDAGLLPGITRAFLFEVGEEADIPVREAVLHDADLLNADEAFFTSTTRGVMPATRVDDHLIGNGVPGPVTRALGAAYDRRARSAK
jgi:branched-chain amino acid aminotransferase